MMSRGSSVPMAPIQSDYVMNQYHDEENTGERGVSLTSLQPDSKSQFNPPSSIPSQYVDMDLRSFIVVNQNRNYQDFPSTIQRKQLIGHPISLNELRRRVDALDSAVYSPMIIDGKLYFVSLDNDIHTARSSRSSASKDDNLSTRTAASSRSGDIADDVTFTLNELKELLPQYSIKKLLRYYKEDRNQKSCTPPSDDALKVREGFNTIGQFTQNQFPSQPAFEIIDLTKTNGPDTIYLRNALNSLQAKQLSAPAAISSTPSLSDTSAKSESVTGNAVSSTNTSVTGLSTPFTAATDEFARCNAETAVDLAASSDALLRKCSVCNGVIPLPILVSDASTNTPVWKNQFLCDRNENLTRPELLTEWDRLSGATAKEYCGGVHTPLQSWSTETAASVDHKTIERILESTNAKRQNDSNIILHESRSPFPRSSVEPRMDTPERDVYTAITIRD